MTGLFYFTGTIKPIACFSRFSSLFLPDVSPSGILSAPSYAWSVLSLFRVTWLINLSV